ncbi:4-coumarate--CoA ligase 1-like [Bombyx mandarina]|uniref:Luciferin 4-monooxygenase n=1 Tax=Bombyx mandarina TaxID=7092 RepID=A0A6J2KMN0_BOMMA|nr:4-coumarate--CoA ligase 1-like [Bombyx mandarina]
MFSKFIRRSFCVARKNVWTPDNVVYSPYRDIEVPDTTIHEYVFRNLDKWATKTAVVCGVTNRAYTFEELYKCSRTLGANLRKKFKLRDGDVIAILLPNVPEYPVSVFGVLAAGGIVTTINPIYTPYEIQRQLDTSGAKIVITLPDLVPNVKKSLELSKKDLKIIAVNIDSQQPEGTISFKELTEDKHIDFEILKEVKRVSDDIAFMVYSSGTTGLPKAVELTHTNKVANFSQQDTELRQYEYTTEKNQDSTLGLLPLFHTYGLSVVMMHKLSVGLKLVTLPSFQPRTFLDALLKHPMELMYLAPPTILFLGAHPAATRDHLKHLKVVTSGAAPLPEADIHKFLEKARPDIQFNQAYGMTEASPLVTLASRDFEGNYSDVGCAVPNVQLRVVDADMKNLGPDEVGELLIKGPNVMRGYKDNPKANEEVFVDGRWYRSGDLARINKDGIVTIVDRLKELIKVKGYQVAPAELEAVLKEHADVYDAAVVGVPDPITGESPRAFVVLNKDSKVDEKLILDYVSEKVAAFKRLKSVTFVDSIPKNPSGKILRKVLKEQYC